MVILRFSMVFGMFTRPGKPMINSGRPPPDRDQAREVRHGVLHMEAEGLDQGPWSLPYGIMIRKSRNYHRDSVVIC